jgi:1-acyl-sn-glycerol-3-phosphate acyltransferase
MASPESLAVKAIAPGYGAAGKRRAYFRLAIILCWIFLNIPVQVVLRLLKLEARRTFPHWFHSILTRKLMGMTIDVVGEPSKTRPTFFLSNHLSYVDIPVLSAALPVSFVSRAEVASWPLLGLLGKLQDTVFVERRARAKTQQQNDALKDFLAGGGNLVLFPEGTSTDGKQVMPFKSALLQGVFDLGRDIPIQPVTIACLNKDGSQYYYPWYGEMDFPEHAWPFLQVPHLHMRITFHAPVKASAFADRKALADYAHNEVIKAPFGVNS